MRLLLFLGLCAALPTAAQLTTSSVSGYVYDPSGRPISEASIAATQTARGLVRKAITGANGFYFIAELPPADYTISASAASFETVHTAPSPLAVHSRLRADFHLPLSGVKQSMEVSANLQYIPTDSAGLGTVFDQSRIQSLPLNRRDFLQLALLAPGVLPAVQDSELSSRGSFAMHAAGGRE